LGDKNKNLETGLVGAFGRYQQPGSYTSASIGKVLRRKHGGVLTCLLAVINGDFLSKHFTALANTANISLWLKHYKRACLSCILPMCCQNASFVWRMLVIFHTRRV